MAAPTKSPRRRAPATGFEASVSRNENAWLQQYITGGYIAGARKAKKPGRVRISKRESDAIWIEALRNLIAGRKPTRIPPGTRDMPRRGEVQIIAGQGARESARMLRESGGHALVWPPGAPATAYRWPVAGRRVLVIALPAAAGTAERIEDFARLLVARWGAVQVRVVGDFAPITVRPEARSGR